MGQGLHGDLSLAAFGGFAGYRRSTNVEELIAILIEPIIAYSLHMLVVNQT